MALFRDISVNLMLSKQQRQRQKFPTVTECMKSEREKITCFLMENAAIKHYRDHDGAYLLWTLDHESPPQTQTFLKKKKIQVSWKVTARKQL